VIKENIISIKTKKEEDVDVVIFFYFESFHLKENESEKQVADTADEIKKRVCTGIIIEIYQKVGNNPEKSMDVLECKSIITTDINHSQ